MVSAFLLTTLLSTASFVSVLSGFSPSSNELPAQIVTSSVHTTRDSKTHTNTSKLQTATTRRAKEHRTKRAALQDVTFSNEFGTFSIQVPAGWKAHPNPQRAIYSNEDGVHATETRIAIFAHDIATLTSLSTERPLLPQFQHVAPVIAAYTDVNTISLLVETLKKPIPSPETITAAYEQNLAFFGYENTVVRNSPIRVAGKRTTLAYSDLEDNNILIQTWTIIADKVYLFTMLSDDKHYNANYADFQKMIASFKLR